MPILSLARGTPQLRAVGSQAWIAAHIGQSLSVLETGIFSTASTSSTELCCLEDVLAEEIPALVHQRLEEHPIEAIVAIYGLTFVRRGRQTPRLSELYGQLLHWMEDHVELEVGLFLHLAFVLWDLFINEKPIQPWLSDCESTLNVSKNSFPVGVAMLSSAKYKISLFENGEGRLFLIPHHDMKKIVHCHEGDNKLIK